MPGVFKIKNLEDAEFTLAHPDGAGAVSIDSNNIAKIDAVNAALALKANTADLKEIGVGQTWQDVTASRSVGVAYTNSTGKPIYLYVRMSLGAYDLQLTINGTIYFNMSNNNGRGSVQAIVPNGSTYAITGAFNVWNELR